MSLQLLTVDVPDGRYHRSLIATTVNQLIQRALLWAQDIVRPEDFGRIGSGNDTLAVQKAFDQGKPVLLTGTYTVDNLTLDTVGQTVFSFGTDASAGRKAVIKRRSGATGPLLTINASRVGLERISIQGTSSGAPGTGDLVAIADNANNCRVIDCVMYYCSSSCINAGQADQLTVRGGTYDNTAASAGTPVIIIGKPTGMTDMVYYFVVDGITLQPSGNPIRIYSSGSGSLCNSQLGGIEFYVGAWGQSVSNRITGNRITGDIYDEGANSSYAGNAFGAHVCTFAAGSSGCLWAGNVRGAGSSIVNSGLTSNIVIEPDYTGVSGYWNFAICEGLRLGNNKLARFYNSAGSDYGHLSMSTGDNMELVNRAGNVVISASAGSRSIVQNAVAFLGDLTPSQITSDQNNYNPTNLDISNTLRLSTDASRTITGLAGGASGRVIFIVNVGSNDLIIANENASSTAANRFVLAADITLQANEGVTLKYDSTSSRWRCVGRHN